jgi:ParB-like nuclease family protein
VAGRQGRAPEGRIAPPLRRNPRTHSPEQVDQLAASIREWGWTVPVLIDEQGGLIAGHGRVLAAKKLRRRRKTTIFAASLALALAPLVASSSVEAKGCLKGAAAGAVAGHVAGHHAVLGAIGGCAVGHHMANKANQNSNQKSTASSQPQHPTNHPSGY